MSNLPRIGWIGPGIMGTPMASRLIAAGYSLGVFARRPAQAAQLTSSGARLFDSPRALTEQADVIISMVGDTADVEEVLLGEQGVIQADHRGQLIIDMSTISPIRTRAIAKQLQASGRRFLDAPVSGGEVGAINGTLTIMVGGSVEDLAAATPLFDHLGQTITHIGNHGTGQIAKTCNQIMVAQILAATGDILRLCAASETDAAKVREALLGGFAYSKILEHHGGKLLNHDLEPGFKAKLHAKDLNIALETLAALGVSSPATTLAADCLNRFIEQGNADKDSLGLASIPPTTSP